MGKLTKVCHYNKEAAYKAKVAPLVDQLFEVCAELELPLYCSVQYVCDDTLNVTRSTVMARGIDDRELAVAPILAAAMMAHQILNSLESDHPEIKSAAQSIVQSELLLSRAVQQARQFENASPSIDAPGVMRA